jgi:hypothetical protein
MLLMSAVVVVEKKKLILKIYGYIGVCIVHWTFHIC